VSETHKTRDTGYGQLFSSGPLLESDTPSNIWCVLKPSPYIVTNRYVMLTIDLHHDCAR